MRGRPLRQPERPAQRRQPHPTSTPRKQRSCAPKSISKRRSTFAARLAAQQAKRHAAAALKRHATRGNAACPRRPVVARQRRRPASKDDCLGTGDAAASESPARCKACTFAHSTRLEAERHCIRGFARNLPDGSVEVVAHGTQHRGRGLRSGCIDGPRMARVERCSNSSSMKRHGADEVRDFIARDPPDDRTAGPPGPPDCPGRPGGLCP